MGGEKSTNFENFIRLSLAAYNVIRGHVNIFFTLFSMVRSIRRRAFPPSLG